MKIRKTEELKTLAILAGRTPEEVAEILTREIEAYGLQDTGRDDRVGTLRWTLDKFGAMLKKIVPEAAEGRAAGLVFELKYDKA